MNKDYRVSKEETLSKSGWEFGSTKWHWVIATLKKSLYKANYWCRRKSNKPILKGWHMHLAIIAKSAARKYFSCCLGKGSPLVIEILGESNMKSNTTVASDALACELVSTSRISPSLSCTEVDVACRCFDWICKHSGGIRKIILHWTTTRYSHVIVIRTRFLLSLSRYAKPICKGNFRQTWRAVHQDCVTKLGSFT